MFCLLAAELPIVLTELRSVSGLSDMTAVPYLSLTNTDLLLPIATFSHESIVSRSVDPELCSIRWGSRSDMNTSRTLRTLRTLRTHRIGTDNDCLFFQDYDRVCHQNTKYDPSCTWRVLLSTAYPTGITMPVAGGVLTSVPFGPAQKRVPVT